MNVSNSCISLLPPFSLPSTRRCMLCSCVPVVMGCPVHVHAHLRVLVSGLQTPSEGEVTWFNCNYCIYEWFSMSRLTQRLGAVYGTGAQRSTAHCAECSIPDGPDHTVCFTHSSFIHCPSSARAALLTIMKPINVPVFSRAYMLIELESS